MRAFRRKVVLSVFVVAMAAFVAPVGAQPKVALAGEATSALAEELNLAPAQKQAIRDIEDEAEKRQLELGAALDAIEIDLRRELEAEQPNDTKVARYIDQVTGLEASMRKTQVLAWLKVRRLLSTSQRARLETLHERGERARVRPPSTAWTPAPMLAPGEPEEGAEGVEDFESFDENGNAGPGPFVVTPPPTPRVPRTWQTPPTPPVAPVAPVAPVPPTPRTRRPDPAPRPALAPPAPPAALPEVPEPPDAPEAP